ncbi:hypothetical protein AC20117_17950 [Arthrobacter crystallopoietes]|nr:hypothetical protein AC20117_17950 [Arthrobacter crystallopoietes]
MMTTIEQLNISSDMAGSTALSMMAGKAMAASQMSFQIDSNSSSGSIRTGYRNPTKARMHMAVRIQVTTPSIRGLGAPMLKSSGTLKMARPTVI